MLQALRFVIQGAGAKVDAVIRKNIVSLLLSMLGHDEVWLQMVGSAGGPFSLVSVSALLLRTWHSCRLVGTIGISDVHIPLWFTSIDCGEDKMGSIDIDVVF